ncbi:type I restriction endonuclease subunit R [Candidatus Venteria ishoeyi]|uniref:Type I restriction enzyme endonuclease subunit n=1 Tax=Candidatus Venteria ishoeyi TaxID=1899563 RepID=A0A1H6FGF0_9GAMM|nr:type I restriction endonuclease subunit R [Candidatus Venteria ishoeyi]SEH08115.1 Type-1 restriction enzyme R protein [Candidatus Venteria ishoeyi]
MQSEAELEKSLITRLNGLGYESVRIKNSDDLRTNLKRQLEKHNTVTLSDSEFGKVLNHLDKGNVFQRAKTLRDRVQISRDDGTPLYLQFINTKHWCQNHYQVTHQISQEGSYKNRYDVTLLVNGLPLVQIELKRRGMELKEAFNQINRYQRHSFWAENGLFQYVQIFVISNGVDTKYYANNRDQDFKQTFYWTDVENTLLTRLEAFSDTFLEKCHLSKMICKYIVLHESNKVLMVLRPYQFYAVEAMFKRVEQSNKNGYIWHTTGSGKTLTSFKAAQVLIELPTVHKVVFVVDRADLDYQTTKEFNYFSAGSVDGTHNTRKLVAQLSGDKRLIITTIQKLNTAITKEHFLSSLQDLQDKRIIFIFDECHRSQFGQTHKNITRFFRNAQLFGFTGTPILVKNASANEHGKRTTADLFGECLHSYVITNAIHDENVLKFAVEYWGKIKDKNGALVDEQVAGINTKEFFESPERIEGIVDWVIQHHERKTHGKKFSAMLCVSSVDALIHYYETFKRKQDEGKHNLRVVTIFTFAANGDDTDANGLIGDPEFDIGKTAQEVQENSVLYQTLEQAAHSAHNRDKLEAFIADYNALYHTQHSAKDGQRFYTYYKDIAKRMKERDHKDFNDAERADILLVVNMFLTGFDAKKLNTLYVDKNLKYHGLIQAYSRTNRTLGDLKSQGNIVCFRNLKKHTDEAIALFSDENAQETILMEPYESYVEKFNDGLKTLSTIAADPDAVNELISEDEQLAFVQAFRQLLRTLNILKPFTEFQFDDLDIDEQTFEDFKSKYLDIYDRTRSKGEGEGASIIEEVDFELELIARDEINVAYILALLAEAHRKAQSGNKKDREESEEKRKQVFALLNKEPRLRSKRELIEHFIQDYMPTMPVEQDFSTVFRNYWDDEKRKAVSALCATEDMNEAAVYAMLDEYLFSGKAPLRETVFAAMQSKPKLMQRKKIFQRVMDALMDIVQRFDEGMGDI